MKTFSVAIAVALVLTFICVLESSATPSTEVEEPEQTMITESPAVEEEEMAVESLTMPGPVMLKRRFRCRFCCRCCKLKGCGVCCRFKF